jgi:hypothetical protein
MAGTGHPIQSAVMEYLRIQVVQGIASNLMNWDKNVRAQGSLKKILIHILSILFISVDSL